ncbi:MAG: hypothetical protein LCH39_04080 [Proteobacteria bacterium]|nr:hypothetical protein [Pseudomonadota bacterium]
MSVDLAARFSSLRLLADDMTGALDSAAAFVPVFGPMPVSGALSDHPTQVLDSATREVEAEQAAAQVRLLAPFLAPAPGRLSFFKVDSLLRGNAGAELAAILERQRFDQVIMANAMPFQGRWTRGGRQVHLRDGVETPTGEDLPHTLPRHGVKVRFARPTDGVGPGVTLFDCESQADLDAIVRAGLEAAGTTLWVGSGGLAGALARTMTRDAVPPPAFSGPVLGLIGSQHPTMLAQLRQVETYVEAVADHGPATVARIARRLSGARVAFLLCDLPAGMIRSEAHARIDARFAGLVRALEPPGLLFVSGGETLHSLMLPLHAEALEVVGEIEPGAPVSRLLGGPWRGTLVLSKSGAFGSEDFLVRLLSRLPPTSKVTA